MDARVTHTDLAGACVLITFSDGTAALFDAAFLYAHSEDSGNKRLPSENRRTNS